MKKSTKLALVLALTVSLIVTTLIISNAAAKGGTPDTTLTVFIFNWLRRIFG